MRTYFLLLSILISIFSFAKQQNEVNVANGKCGTAIPSKSWETNFQYRLKQFKSNSQLTGRNENTYIIPVIIHVIYAANNATQNISKAQIDSQIVILNRNFAGNSEFIGNVPTPFKPLIANSGITFCLAKYDPSGRLMAEEGVERINRSSLGLIAPGINGWNSDYIDASIKPKTIWDPRYYLNIWIVPAARSGTTPLLGYATFPTMTTLNGIGEGSGTIESDGVVCVANAFGKSITNELNYNSGATTTHEIGHWLGLRHIWGDETCGNDFCDDTPTHNEANSGCPIYPKNNNCGNAPNGEMFMNYMDYSVDNCLNMFTNGQKDRMITALQNGNLRVPLTTSPVCGNSQPFPVANFVDSQVTNIRCIDTVYFNFKDKSLFAYNATSWQWIFEGGIPSTSTVQNPTNIRFTTPGSKLVKLTITTPLGTSVDSQYVNATFTSSNMYFIPYSEDFEEPTFPPQGWSFIKRSTVPNADWEEREGYSGYGVGNKSMIYDNTNYDAGSKLDDILSPKFDLTGKTDVKLLFDVAYTPFYGETSPGNTEVINDTIEILLTNDCGTTFTSIYKKGGSELATFLPGIGEEFYPTSNQWRTDTALIANSLLLNNTQFVFRNYGLYGHTVYIDNINLIDNQVSSFTISDSTICKGQSITFTNTSTNSPDSVRWIINGGSPSTSTSLTTVTSIFNNAGIYPVSLIVYKGTTIKDTITKNVYVYDYPTVTVNPSSIAVCPGQSATLTASGATSYSWNTNQTTNSINVSPTSNTNFTVIGSTNGCADTATASVTMKTKPTVTIVPSGASICIGESIMLSASGATTYGWNNGNTTSSITVSPTINTTYKVAGIGSNGCLSDSASTTVTVKPKPTVSISPTSAVICAGQSVTFVASGATTYGWSNGSTGSNITVSPTVNTTYKVAGTTNACLSDSVATTVTITTTNPTVTINKNPNISTICEGDSIILTASGAGTYSWNNGASTASIVIRPTINTTYTVTGTITGCSSLQDNESVTINVNPRPSTGTITRGGWDTIYCSPIISGATYKWYLNNSTTPIATTTVPYYFATTNGNYSVQIMNSNSCNSIRSANFNVVLTAIKNNASDIKLSIYPNPSDGNFTIELQSLKTTTYQLKLFNIAGRELFNDVYDVNKGANIKSYHLQNIEKGIYLLNLQNEEGVATYQLLIH